MVELMTTVLAGIAMAMGAYKGRKKALNPEEALWDTALHKWFDGPVP